jgi:hypothetical protein
MALGPGQLCDATHKGAADADDVKVHAAIVAMGIMQPMEFMDQSPGGLRAEIAAAAASLIAEDGFDYESAKRKAFDRVTGGKGGRIAREVLPSNQEIEDAVREYQQIFQADTQPARLLELRTKALALMELLQDFSPTVAGAIANGTAGEHTDIHLQCFADNAKAIGIFLIDQRISADAATLPHFRSQHADVEALAIHWQGELATIAVYPEIDLRGALKPDSRGRVQRLDIDGLRRLLETR